MENRQLTDYQLEVWAEVEAMHNGGYFGEVEDLRELDRYEMAHSSYPLLSVQESD